MPFTRALIQDLSNPDVVILRENFFVMVLPTFVEDVEELTQVTHPTSRHVVLGTEVVGNVDHPREKVKGPIGFGEDYGSQVVELGHHGVLRHLSVEVTIVEHY
jgi:hypothetical protein